MREIKFRAWDKRFNWFDFGGGDLLLRINSEDFSDPQQFTGLIDKNGKEIYEGDIVYNEADKYNYQIIWNEREARFTLGEDSGPLSTYVLGTFWEVIGNIFENPELLN